MQDEEPEDKGGITSVAVLELVDCQGHLSDVRKKYGTFICNRFIEHTRKIDPHN